MEGQLGTEREREAERERERITCGDGGSSDNCCPLMRVLTFFSLQQLSDARWCAVGAEGVGIFVGI